MKFNFKLFLETQDLFHGWMDKFGNMNPVVGKNHIEKACKITEMTYPDCFEFLFKNNWMRMTYYGKDLYIHNPKKYPTEKQKNELINLALEKRMDRIVYDNEEEEKIMWSHDYI